MSEVRDLMTAAPFTVARTELVGPVRDAMLASGIHCLPVIDVAGRPVGIVSSWDLVEEHGPEEPVENAMTPKVITVGPHESIEEAAMLMRLNFIHHLVVVNEADEVVGVVSSLDLLSELSEIR